MTIADNLTALAQQKLGYQDSVEACKTSLINKDVVVPVGAKLADISGLIDEIQQDPSIPVGTGKWLITWWDYDGKVLKRQRVNTGENATAPAIPTHQYLTFAEWNNPFTNVQSDIDTGAIYNTTDGKTYLFITLTAVTGLAPTLYFSKSSTSLMTIDWGDGTTSTSTTSGNQNINHVYATAGDYIVTVDNSAGGTWQIGGANSFLNLYTSILFKVYLGNYITFAISAFSSYFSLSIISLGTYHINRNTCFRLTPVNHINVGNITTELGQYEEMPSLIKLIEKDGQLALAVNTVNKSIIKRIIPKTVNLIAAFALINCTSIVEYIFLSTTPPTLVNINAFTGINPICKIYVPDASVAAYKAATNWSFYANYIYPLSQKPQSNE